MERTKLFKIINRIPETDFSSNKLSGMDKIIQVDKNMLNYKIKSHKGTPPTNKTSIIEYDNKIKRMFKCTIKKNEELTQEPKVLDQSWPRRARFIDYVGI